MMDENTIIRMTRENQTSMDNIAREYCQHLFLSHFYRQPQSEKILFKGGTALRILWRSPRFSENLDFSKVKIIFVEIDTLIRKTILEVTRAGCDIDLAESKETSGGYLGRMIFKWFGFKIAIQIEISSRKKTIHVEQALVQNDFIPAYVIHHLSQEELIAEKIQAMLTRAKPRDYFDLYFILRSRLAFQTVLNQDKTLKQKIIKHLKDTDTNFSKELKHFLPISHHTLLKNFPSILEKEINRAFP